MHQAIAFALQQQVAYVDQTGAPTGKRMAAMPPESGAGSGSW